MSKDSFENAIALGSTLGFSLEDGPKPYAKLDAGKYEEFFDGTQATDEEKELIIALLIQIGMEFYDSGFGLDMTGQGCGKLEESQDDSAPELQDMVSYRAISLSEKFNQCAA